MSLIEWIGEHFNPGPVGRSAVGPPEPSRLPLPLVWAHGLIGLALIAWALYAAATAADPGRWIALVLGYLAIAFLVRPRPNLDNVGWFGGLMNNPFRISDDINRFLVFALIVLWPGRFAVTGVRDLVTISRQAGD